MNVTEVEAALKNPGLLANLQEVTEALAAEKDAALAENDEVRAKYIWCLEEVAAVHSEFLSAFHSIKDGRFYEGWCELEQAELAIGRLRRHFAGQMPDFRIDFIERKVIDIQGLYPYKVFMSPELIELEKRCNICDAVVSIRNHCGHKVGEIYGGKHCGRVVTKWTVVGMAMVKTPVQKYSVPFPVDKSGKSEDRYNYATVEYLAKRWYDPYSPWAVEWTKAYHPKERFGTLRRNDKCPCESGKKYKACCMRKDGILRPHVVFDFGYDIPGDLQSVEFSY